jgi:hypothetical protein
MRAMVVDAEKRIATATRAEKLRLSDRARQRLATAAAVLILLSVAAFGAFFPYL